MTEEELTDLIADDICEAIPNVTKDWAIAGAQAVIAALEEVTVLPVWRTIESAPKDGTWIWICDNRFKPSESSHLIAKWHPQLKCWQGPANTKGRFAVWHEATHWMLIPTPPGELT